MRRQFVLAALTAVGLSVAVESAQAQQIFSGVGASATTQFNDFRTAAGGRRITWDGVRLDGTDFGGDNTVIDLDNTVGIALNRFQAAGALYNEITAVSGDGFASVNPTSAGQFPAFSPTRTFASFNDNVIEQSFVFPSAPTTVPIPAGVRGFGAIFLDVELPQTSNIEFFNGTTSLGKYFVEPGADQETEFLGVLFDQPIVTSVKLTMGNATLFNFNGTAFSAGATENLPNGMDLAVTDDFVFAEPTAAVPEPAPLALIGAGIVAAAFARLRRARNS